MYSQGMRVDWRVTGEAASTLMCKVFRMGCTDTIGTGTVLRLKRYRRTCAGMDTPRS